MNFSNNRTTVSVGRNGAYSCIGFHVGLQDSRPNGRHELVLQGVTSRGSTASGDLTVPIEDAPALIAQLQAKLAEYTAAGRTAGPVK